MRYETMRLSFSSHFSSFIFLFCFVVVVFVVVVVVFWGEGGNRVGEWNLKQE